MNILSFDLIGTVREKNAAHGHTRSTLRPKDSRLQRLLLGLGAQGVRENFSYDKWVEATPIWILAYDKSQVFKEYIARYDIYIYPY